MSHLAAEIHRLVDQQTLTPAQGDRLWRAGEQDRHDAAAGAAPRTPPEARSGAVLEVLG